MSERKVILKIIVIALLILTTFCPAVALASPSDRPAITVLHPSRARSFIVGKNLFKFQHFATEENAEVKTLATAEITLAPNYDGFLLQKHVVDSDETIYAIDGGIQCLSSQSNTAIALRAGDVAHIPAGIPYGCKTMGSKPSKLLLVTAFPALESLIAEVGTPANNPTQATVEPNMVQVAAVAQKYGIQFLN